MTDKDLVDEIRLHIDEINKCLKAAYLKQIEVGFIFKNKEGEEEQKVYMEPGDKVTVDASKHVDL